MHKLLGGNLREDIQTILDPYLDHLPNTVTYGEQLSRYSDLVQYNGIYSIILILLVLAIMVRTDMQSVTMFALLAIIMVVVGLSYDDRESYEQVKYKELRYERTTVLDNSYTEAVKILSTEEVQEELSKLNGYTPRQINSGIRLYMESNYGELQYKEEYYNG